ncbi:MAG: hypothetical protein RH917_14485 [Lacipirellulaceae bacterium]
MNRFALSASLVLTLAATSSADVIKPNDVRATSQFGVGLNVENLVNGDQGAEVGISGGFGLVAAGGAGVLDDSHVLSTNSVPRGWISGCGDAGIAGGDPGVDCASNPFAVNPEEEQIVEFEFDGAYDLTAMHIWNENDETFAPDRGVDEFELQTNPDRTGGTFTSVGTFNLLADDGFSNNFAQVINLSGNGIRRVRLLVNSRHGGPSEDYVGLAEVRFEGTLVTQDHASDGDKNGSADGGDFLIVQRGLKTALTGMGLGEVETTFNSTLSATQSEGDYDNNNVVNPDDLSVWQGEYGGPPSSTSSIAAVPEPNAVAIAILAALGAMDGRRITNRDNE